MVSSPSQLTLLGRSPARSAKQTALLPGNTFLATGQINNCQHTFKQLASMVLPAHMKRMRHALQDSKPLSTFAREGVGVRTLLNEQGLKADFSGCYVMIEKNEPIYVGISRGVLGRLRQHVYGRTHFDASLAFQIAFRRHPDRAIEALSRQEEMSSTNFGTSFSEAQQYLRSLQVAYIDISNPLELYVFEAYCAMELDTHQWNSFQTH